MFPPSYFLKSLMFRLAMNFPQLKPLYLSRFFLSTSYSSDLTRVVCARKKKKGKDILDLVELTTTMLQALVNVVGQIKPWI